MDRLHSVISDFCKRGWCNELTYYLNIKRPFVNILAQNGEFFRIALFNNNKELFQVLLDFYENNYLFPINDINKYLHNEKKLACILYNILEEFVASPYFRDISYDFILLYEKYLPSISELDEMESLRDLDDEPDPTGDYDNEGRDQEGEITRENFGFLTLGLSESQKISDE